MSKNYCEYHGVLRSMEKNGRVCVPIEFWRMAGIRTSDKVSVILSAQKEIIVAAVTNNVRGYIGAERIVAANGQIAVPISYRRTVGLECGGKVEVFLSSQKEIIMKACN